LWPDKTVDLKKGPAYRQTSTRRIKREEEIKWGIGRRTIYPGMKPTFYIVIYVVK